MYHFCVNHIFINGKTRKQTENEQTKTHKVYETLPKKTKISLKKNVPQNTGKKKIK